VKDTPIATQKACSQRFRRDELPDCAPYQLGHPGLLAPVALMLARREEAAIVLAVDHDGQPVQT
jgi:hypothetical protein